MSGNPDTQLLGQWGLHVLKEIERLSGLAEKSASKTDLSKIEGALKSIENCVHEAKREIVALKVKSGIWGLLGGAVPAALLLIAYFIKQVP